MPLAEAVAELDRLPPARRRRPGGYAAARASGSGSSPSCAPPGWTRIRSAVPRTCSAADLRGRHRGLAAGERSGVTESVTGRVRALRDFGGLVFAELQDGCDSIQALLDPRRARGARLDLWRQTVDLGDHVSVRAR